MWQGHMNYLCRGDGYQVIIVDTCTFLQRLFAQASGAEVGELDLSVIGQTQQLCQRINLRFTVHDDQALQAVPGIFR